MLLRAERYAQNLYRRAYNAAGFGRAWARLLRRPYHLLALAEAAGPGSRLSGDRRYLGIQVVPVEDIVGSENRSADFDLEFRPLEDNNQQRWVHIAAAIVEGETLPPVDLIRVNGLYFVRDGHHRISVARAMRQKYIDAEVVEQA